MLRVDSYIYHHKIVHKQIGTAIMNYHGGRTKVTSLEDSAKRLA